MSTRKTGIAWLIALLFTVASGHAQEPEPEPVPPPPPPGMVPGGMMGGPSMGMPGPEGMAPFGRGEMAPGMPGMFVPPRGEPGRTWVHSDPEFRRREQVVMEVLGSVNPDEVEKLKLLRVGDLRAYMERIEERWPEAQELEELRLHDPERFKTMIRIRRMEVESHQLAQKARMLEGESRAQALEGLRRMLEHIFDFKQQQREREVERLSKELQRLKEGLERRAAHREEIIDRRKGELLGEVEPLEW